MSTKEILKPCPCCDGVAELHETEGCDYVVSCGGCGLQILDDMRWEEKGYDARANVIEKWNTRGGTELGATNQTSFNWKEVKKNGDDANAENNALLPGTNKRAVIPEQLLDSVVKIEQILSGIFQIAGDAPELNMSNYDEDEADKLNDAMIEIYNLAKQAYDTRTKNELVLPMQSVVPSTLYDCDNCMNYPCALQKWSSWKGRKLKLNECGDKVELKLL